MVVIRKLKNLLLYLKENGPLKTVKFTLIKLRVFLASFEATWILLFKLNPFIKTGLVTDYSNLSDKVINDLKSIKEITIKNYNLNINKFLDYLKAANYEQFSPYYEGNNSGREDHRTDKLLQHFISLDLLEMNSNDTFIDIASNTSPIRHIVKALYNCKVYSLDLSYKKGINGELIGSDAGNIPLPNESVTKMTLHCSFEHFAYGADIRFIKELKRVLSKGGKVCIIPLYILSEYSVRVDPLLEIQLGAEDLEGAKKVYVRDYRVDYGRHYSPKSFYERIVKNSSDLKLSIVNISGLEDLKRAYKGQELYSRLALLIEKN